MSEITEGINAFLQGDKYTGWYVLLKRDGYKWKTVCCLNPKYDDNMPEDYDLILPIPNPEAISEFKGF